MTFGLAVFGVALALLGGLWRSWQLWRNSTSDLDGWPPALLRAFPSISLTLCASLIGGSIVWLLDQSDVTDDISPFVAMLVTVAVLFCLVFVATTAVRAKPEWLVPPHLRAPRRKHETVGDNRR
jgi:hypothetical protein